MAVLVVLGCSAVLPTLQHQLYLKINQEQIRWANKRWTAPDSNIQMEEWKENTAVGNIPTN
jgi:hypothetical protein